MKYDLKAMKFNPEAGNTGWAFLWHHTPEGYDYWAKQYLTGPSPEGQAKWDAMKQQWNEESGVEREVGTLEELDVKPGDVVERFQDSEIWPSGEYVIDSLGRITDGMGDTWSLGSGEYAYCDGYPTYAKFRIVSRAEPAEPQRYVVETPTYTIICNRTEAETRAASGIATVYKLGDKVNVTVKVEFE